MDKRAETRSFGQGTVGFSKTIGSTTYFGELVNYRAAILDLSPLKARNLPGYSSMLLEARTSALAQVARPDFTGLVSLGELRESLSYLRNPFKGAIKLANTLERRIARLYVEERRQSKKGRKPVKAEVPGGLNPDDARIVKELEGIYLEFRYGVRPMIGEITSFLENLRERVSPKPKRQTFRSKKRQTDDDSWSVLETDGNNIQSLASYFYEREILVSVGLLYEFDIRDGIAEKWGLELGQLPATAWALAPLSFVVDWGLNVSQLIAAVTPVAGATRLCEWESVKITETLRCQRTNWKFSDWPGSTGSVGQDSVQVVTYQRRPYIGIPGLVVKQTALDVFSDVAKVLDLSAIFHQKVRNALDQGRQVSSAIQRRTGRPLSASRWYG
jgi:hypothetical protein